MKKNKPIFDAEPQFDFESMSFSKNEATSEFNLDRVELPGDADPGLQNEVNAEIKNLDQAQKNAGEMDSFYQKKIEQKWSLLDRWLDRNMYDQVQKVKEEMFHLTSRQRLSMYDLLLQSRLQHTREKYDSSLKCIKAHYRRNIASYIMSQMEDLTEDIKGYQFRFLESMKSKYNYAETLKKYPSMHDKYMRSLFQQEERYLAFLDKLILKFEAVVSEELATYSFK
ncbi:MAG: hypothetical protein KA767_01775 [Saprospiraceae bacterium]|jgi:hypothetical protein|nr:hypothetical protein [Saprospiraceae bacterium]MBP9196252.1 hypothetical protein [Saprospiraceae bacterium]